MRSCEEFRDLMLQKLYGLMESRHRVIQEEDDRSIEVRIAEAQRQFRVLEEDEAYSS